MSEYRPIEERRRDWREVERPLAEPACRERAQACLSCGLPFCHGLGCPLANPIPETNAAVAAGDDALAHALLAQTDPFPEFTSRVCPALCEGSCTGGIEDEPVMVRQLEKATVETAFRNGWVKPFVPEHRNGKQVTVIGSGPSGLALFCSGTGLERGCIRSAFRQRSLLWASGQGPLLLSEGSLSLCRPFMPG